jgi:hypothetical protein
MIINKLKLFSSFPPSFLPPPPTKEKGGKKVEFENNGKKGMKLKYREREKGIEKGKRARYDMRSRRKRR